MSNSYSKNKITQHTPSKKVLKNEEGRTILEEAMTSGDLLYVKEDPKAGRDFGTFVKKADLEELLSVKIIDKDELSAAGNLATAPEGGYFYFGGMKFWYTDDSNPEDIRRKGLKYLVAAEELERFQTEKKAKAAEAAEKAEKLRLKALKEEGEKRREIDKLKTALSREGVSWAQEVATSLYAKGVRA